MGQSRVFHTCTHIKNKENTGSEPYICELTGANCSSQFYCHNEKYWRPTYQIKCPNFLKREEQKNK
jgi:hypothetical protein